VPLATAGRYHDSVFAFARVSGSRAAVTCVPRLVASVVPEPTAPPIAAVWADTEVHLPSRIAGTPLRDAFTGKRFDPADRVPVASLFELLPAALLVPTD
jgi:(1->4)-alpha-D-glucan 1-alpha-D-glucosylmutase